jgi:hypothetical protein
VLGLSDAADCGKVASMRRFGDEIEHASNAG